MNRFIVKKVFSASAAVSVLQIKYSFVKPKHSNHYISYVKSKMTRGGTILA